MTDAHQDEDLRTRRVAAISAPTRTLPRAAKGDLKLLDRLSVEFDRAWDRVRDRGLDLRRFALELDHFKPDLVQYEGTPWRYLPSVLPRREVDPDDVFVDIGCGKGRIVLQAATRYRLGRVIGVEVAPALAEVARLNLEAAPHRRRVKVAEIVVADAAEWTVPDDVTIVYMFHPFAGETFAACMRNVLESHDRRPRRIRLAYACPLQHDVLAATGRFRLVRRAAFRPKDHPARQIHLYEVSG